MSIDNVKVDVIPTCKKPTDLFVIYWPKSGASIGAFRAYFDLGSNGDAVREFRLNFGGEGSTQGIVSLTTNPAPKGIVYTLDGRKLDKMPTRKGLYIENGHKVVIK